ncbi:50S ribosomal protein L15 [Polaribacter reichenbachii]|uniref:Large ribosomal subunit protein uL15 n=1 Tax=Polaribacter reichenbachii TaxID=996801 RepID=A0A1B8TWF7_9FLAO|nr:50S ribosomal protein L15 [Polaribacter reichenbachii]APZ45042.1 50S ribosomal protein L15 [Polaribacter reichenbachii]AUC18905.1 50S ribosomal protein L15 [Polaribacter reichenbachii]OBY63938.1 50S ribosomal protein L15 [Polaribacter reichenbachii]
MSSLHNLTPAEGSVKKEKRIARGEGSGHGGTSTRGHKGAKSRSGYSRKIGFEGGQMPLQRRVPKFGFTNINRKEYQGINLDKLQALVDSGKITDTVDLDILIANRLAGKNDLIKILGGGELKAKLNITVHKYTASAKAAIEAAGGEAVTL